jgi:hypothetical protein
MSRKKANRKAAKKAKVSQHSTIEQHDRQGKMLIPPLANLPNVQPMSWRDDRLPEMLWAALLVAHLPRFEALNVFRELAEYAHQYRDTDSPDDVTHAGLEKLKPQRLLEMLCLITRTDERKYALRSLRLLEDLPAKGS